MVFLKFSLFQSHTLTEENEWQIEYQATTDEQTLLIQPIMSTLI